MSTQNSVGSPNLRRRGTTSRTSGFSTSGTGGGNTSRNYFSARLYSDEAPGLKVGPTSVMIFSFVFIAFVVVLHIWSKFRG
ncbi:uncharacterized protein Gasu_45880 [Galdieria sulphuraria]|uniref:Protein transport protein Sec61 subunit beta n=1 Tax=Galdieria sulphuraria TaxID=130081 RepID=M2VXE6_GALSU|nr:uncharacterized protein Gasu_45880 [Galdieria sulphuraria]EME27926.1 hypothetical protein Gasu_45880 [Galdieria sulphuraria]|eukprot:XP_005704446.1 hypothetical protein Gasu_45880 [Galdieria sulphuraria]